MLARIDSLYDTLKFLRELKARTFKPSIFIHHGYLIFQNIIFGSYQRRRNEYLVDMHLEHASLLLHLTPLHLRRRT